MVSQTEPEPPRPLVAVLDTNVILDIYTCADLARTYDRLGAAGVDQPEAVYRRARARESLLLAICLNKIAASTYGLHNETLAMMVKRADPDAVTTFETHFTTRFVYFVKDHVLPDWQHHYDIDNDAVVRPMCAYWISRKVEGYPWSRTRASASTAWQTSTCVPAR